MDHRPLRWLGLAFMVGGLTITGAACSDDKKDDADSTTTEGADGDDTSTTGAAGDASAIEVKLFQFEPESFTVAAGDEIVWNNEDDTDHQPTSGAPGAITDTFDVLLSGKGASGSTTIAEPGTYEYFCQIHDAMVGTITVE